VTPLTFSADDVRRWAALSGDRNPVHFEGAFARRTGLPGPIAHGMLVLHAVKPHLAPPASGAWWGLSARLRLPVPLDTPVGLSCHDREGGAAFAVSFPDGQPAVTGSFRPPGCPPVEVGALSKLPAEWVTDRFAAARRLFPAVTDPWAVADAVLFGLFLRTGIARAVAAHGLDLARDGWHAVAAAGRVVLQITHEVEFDQSFWAVFEPTGLTVSSLPDLHTAAGGDRLVTCGWVTGHAGRAVMAARVRLVIRSVPQPGG
jgi:hypothetical protein